MISFTSCERVVEDRGRGLQSTCLDERLDRLLEVLQVLKRFGVPITKDQVAYQQLLYRSSRCGNPLRREGIEADLQLAKSGRRGVNEGEVVVG